jgi:hypothetical protein
VVGTGTHQIVAEMRFRMCEMLSSFRGDVKIACLAELRSGRSTSRLSEMKMPYPSPPTNGCTHRQTRGAGFS